MIKLSAVLVPARWRNISNHESQPQLSDGKVLRKSDLLPSARGTFLASIQPRPQPPQLLHLGVRPRPSETHPARGSGRRCRNNPRGDAQRRSAKCAQTHACMHELRPPAVTSSTSSNYPKNADSQLSSPIFEFEIHFILSELNRFRTVQLAC